MRNPRNERALSQKAIDNNGFALRSETGSVSITAAGVRR
jgi:hypothetical protein